jgi:hypothetical protein
MVTGIPRIFKTIKGMIKIKMGERRDIKGAARLYMPRQCKKPAELFNFCKHLRLMY